MVWVGPELSPWLEKPVDTLSGDALTVKLLGIEGLDLLEFGEDHHDHDGDHHDEHGADHADHDDHDDHDGHDGHDEHDDHGHKDDHAQDEDGHHDEDGHKDEHAHDDHAGKDDHADHEGHDHHDHDGVDPHAWMDPIIAADWLEPIAVALGKADPDNADTYLANAKAAHDQLIALNGEINTALAPIHDQPFVAFHDAYGYLERRYNLTNAGALAPGDATAPGAARLAELKAEVQEKGIKCAFAEPQFDPALLKVVGEGTGMTIGTLDPLGSDLALGAEFYPNLMRALAGALTDCLQG